MNEYKIVTMADLLKIPPERINDCLDELKGFLDSARAFHELVKLVGESIGQPNAECEPLAFIWIDDGKRDQTITIETPTKSAGREGSEK